MYKGGLAVWEEGRDMTDYVLNPSTVAVTLQHRAQAGHRHHLTICQDGALEVGLEQARPLFRLLAGQLDSPWGQSRWSSEELEDVEPDPLWESMDGICSHMEEDHFDTFATFLSMVGRHDRATGMPWVESRGFFLSTTTDYVFIPFPTPCTDANSVRVALITMLRKARAAHG